MPQLTHLKRKRNPKNGAGIVYPQVGLAFMRRRIYDRGMETKEDLLRKVREIEVKEAQNKKEIEKQKNYEKFLEREPDWVIGLAHCDIGTTKIDYDWYSNRFHTIGNAISIHGNCGTSYKSRARITSATNTYFHNVWNNRQRAVFQKALDKVALKEITKIMNSLQQKLEILGLQSEDFFLREIYPKDKVKEIQEEVWKQTVKLLDTYKDKDFKDLLRKYSGETDRKDFDLSHSRRIVSNYIKEKRPHLVKFFGNALV